MTAERYGEHARVETGWSLHGQPAAVLVNGLLRVVVLPGLGGRIWQITHLPSGRDLLWNHPSRAPQPVAFGSTYDDEFVGGWDELFPNDLPETLAGEAYPDHGELWSERWSADVLSGDAAAVRLTLRTRVSACEVTRVITLPPGRPVVHLDVTVRSTGTVDLPMMHKQHLAVALTAMSRLQLPSATVELGDFGRPRAAEPGAQFGWPSLAGHDMRARPPDGISELMFARDLQAGWCAVVDPSGPGIGLVFDREIYPACWTFASFRGWRGLDVLVLEPCTGTGLSVLDGVETGRHRVLRAGEELRTRVTACVLEPASDIGSLDVHGDELVVDGAGR